MRNSYQFCRTTAVLSLSLAMPMRGRHRHRHSEASSTLRCAALVCSGGRTANRSPASVAGPSSHGGINQKCYVTSRINRKLYDSPTRWPVYDLSNPKSTSPPTWLQRDSAAQRFSNVRISRMLACTSNHPRRSCDPTCQIKQSK